MTTDPTSDLIPTGEVARRLGVSVRTVHRLVDAERLQVALIVAGAYVFRREDVDALIGESEAASA